MRNTEGTVCPTCGCAEPPVDELESWHMVPEDPEDQPVPSRDFAPNGRVITGAVIRAGGLDRFSTVVTSERHVGSIDVVGRCLALNHEGSFITRFPGHPASLRIRLTVPFRMPGNRRGASGFTAAAAIFPSGRRLGIIDCAIAMEPSSVAEGCIMLAEPRDRGDEFLPDSEVAALLAPMNWDDDRVRFLRGLIRFDLLEHLRSAREA